jgi:FKBP12-rapamycin complex-associated protein
MLNLASYWLGKCQDEFFVLHVFLLSVYLLRLFFRCYLRLGQWQESLQGINEQSIPAVLQYYAAATEHDATWYKAWHSWAYMNFEAVLFFKHQGQNSSANQTLLGDNANKGLV